MHDLLLMTNKNRDQMSIRSGTFPQMAFKSLAVQGMGSEPTQLYTIINEHEMNEDKKLK